jgi:tRNA(fMet)-specific endonuclease VapC
MHRDLSSGYECAQRLDARGCADDRLALSMKADDQVIICSIVRGEIVFGLHRLAPGRRRSELEEKARKLFAVLPCEPVPPVAGDWYADVKISQQRRGLSLDENDLWIAATTLAMGATLVGNDSDFRAVEGLAVLEP